MQSETQIGDWNTNRDTKSIMDIFYWWKVGLWGLGLIHLIFHQKYLKANRTCFAQYKSDPWCVTSNTLLLITTVLHWVRASKSVLVVTLFRMSQSQWNDPFLIKGCVASNHKYIIRWKHKGCTTSTEAQNISIPVTHINNHTSLEATFLCYSSCYDTENHLKNIIVCEASSVVLWFYHSVHKFSSVLVIRLWAMCADGIILLLQQKHPATAHLTYIFNSCRFCYITREKCKETIKNKKQKKPLCLGVFVFTQRVIFTSRARA